MCKIENDSREMAWTGQHSQLLHLGLQSGPVSYEYLEFEEAKFPLYFMEDYPPGMKVEEIMVDAKAQKETQIQNIAITIDKIMHVLE